MFHLFRFWRVLRNACLASRSHNVGVFCSCLELLSSPSFCVSVCVGALLLSGGYPKSVTRSSELGRLVAAFCYSAGAQRWRGARGCLSSGGQHNDEMYQQTQNTCRTNPGTSFYQKKTLRGAPQPRKGLINLETNINDVNDVIDVMDLNQLRLDSGLSK
jgi:hypothetical protein